MTNSCIENLKESTYGKLTLGAITPGKSLVGSISRSTSTPEVYVGLSCGYGKRNSNPDVSNVAITFCAAGG